MKNKKITTQSYEDLLIHTQYDGHDYRSVLGIYHYDENGEEAELINLTTICQDISTCADQGQDTWSWIKRAVECRLNNKGISFRSVSFSDTEDQL